MTLPSPLPEELRRFAAGVAAQEVLREAAEALAEAGISVIPLKGAFLQRALYADPSLRFSSDVDLLVRPQQFQRAAVALLGAGFRCQKVGKSMIEAAFASRRGLAVDLHCRLFGWGRFRLSTEAVFERARRDDELFGVPVLVANPYDTAAHLVGKLVTDHVAADVDARLSELARFARSSGLEPKQLARHCHAHGLGRAARFAFGLGALRPGDDDFFAQSLASLPADPLGAACAWVVSRSLPRARSTLLGSALARVLDASIPRGLASVGLAGVHRARHAVLEGHRRRRGAQWVPFRVAAERSTGVVANEARRRAGRRD